MVLTRTPAASLQQANRQGPFAGALQQAMGCEFSILSSTPNAPNGKNCAWVIMESISWVDVLVSLNPANHHFHHSIVNDHNLGINSPSFRRIKWFRCPWSAQCLLQVSVLDGEEDQSIRDEIGRLVRQGLSNGGFIDSIDALLPCLQVCDDCSI